MQHSSYAVRTYQAARVAVLEENAVFETCSLQQVAKECFPGTGKTSF